MIVVLHRERSEKLARAFTEEMADQDASVLWRELAPGDQEVRIRAFDALIQDGLIGEQEPVQ